MINIGFDLTSLIYQRGVSRYTTNLVRAIAQQPNVSCSYYASTWRQKRLLTKLIDQNLPVAQQEIIQDYPVSLLGKIWQLGFNPVSKLLPQINIFHAWEWQLPPDKNLPLIVTIHDLAMLHFPKAAHPEILAKHQQSWRRIADSGAHIIAVSQATKTDVINLLKIPLYRIHVVHEALPTELFNLTRQMSEQQLEKIKARLQPSGKPYLFFVGTREPRKNLHRLIEAWQPLAKEFDLLIAGQAGWDQVEKQAWTSQPRFLGQVTDQELSVLYTEAAAFVYPSLYEGFGLPILEAFHHGTPVVTSNSSAMIEVAGNAAELVEPESVESIRAGMQKILNESPRDQAVRMQRMIIRLQMFDWQTTAQQTILAYQACINDYTQRRQ